MDSMLNDLDQVTAWLDSATKKEVADMIRRLFEYASPEELAALSRLAREQVEQYYGRAVYFRGLIEFSSYCRNDCFYCGLRKNNPHATRYRLSKQEIVACCAEGRALGFRTFVLQSGEDEHFDDDRLCGIVSTIATRFPDCAVTLSVGERSRSSYLRLFEAGAARYLLRHETADESHYARLHPPELSLRNRKKCLIDLKEIGFQVGAGFMVDAPHQTYDSLAEDFVFLRDLQPHMVGIGPFVPHKDTRFAGYSPPSSRHTLILLSLLRIMLPKVLLPATTALATIDPDGRERGILAGANVVMINLSPKARRKEYSLYDGKICVDEEAAESLALLSHRLLATGYVPDFSRGDHADSRKDDGEYEAGNKTVSRIGAGKSTSQGTVQGKEHS